VTLVDTNVILDILSNDPTWRIWSAETLSQRASQGPLLVTDTVYAELSVQFTEEEHVDSVIASLGLVLQRIPKKALFVAGRAFERYRRAGGLRPNVLADFFIGAHAQIEGLPILTRDTRRYRTYFPDVELIAPGA
jgi:predicted nucleic acid-binding protein